VISISRNKLSRSIAFLTITCVVHLCSQHAACYHVSVFRVIDRCNCIFITIIGCRSSVMDVALRILLVIALSTNVVRLRLRLSILNLNNNATANLIQYLQSTRRFKSRSVMLIVGCTSKDGRPAKSARRSDREDKDMTHAYL
jgi:hypothetical protein